MTTTAPFAEAVAALIHDGDPVAIEGFTHLIVVIVAPHNRRPLVERLDFRTTVGFGDGPGYRQRLGFRGRGPSAVITDLGLLEPDPETKDLTLTELHAGATLEEAREATGWPLAAIAEPRPIAPPDESELEALREPVSR